MESGPGLEDGTIDVERLLVEPQDGHASMDSVLCFNEKTPENTMNMEDVSRSFGYHIPNDFCSMGEDYLLGFDFAESITNLDYGSTEALQTSVSDSPIMASNAGTDTPWKSDPFRIMEVAERENNQLLVSSSELGDIPSCRPEPQTLAEEKSLKSLTSPNIDSFNDISSCSFQDILSDENVASPSPSVEMLCCPKTEKIDEFGFTGQDSKTKGQDALATISGQAGLTEAPPKQKRSRKPTQRYIDELSDPISRYSKKRREVSSSTIKDKSLGVKDHKKCHTGYKTMRLPDEDSSVKAIQVPFASLVHKECPKSQEYVVVSFEAHSSDRSNSMTKSKDNRFTLENQKKRDECTTSLHPKRRDDCVPAPSQKKRDDHNTATNQKKRDDWIITVSPKKREPRAAAVSEKKRDEENDDCLYEESSEEVSGRRKHHRLWTIAEVRKLIDGVSQHGVGRWSRIKKLFFSTSPHRTSVDLKDKWRNLLKASGIKEQGDRQGEKKRNMAWRPLPKSILRRVCELATMHPYPKGRKHKIGHLHHDSPDRSTDITLSDYRKILRSINSN
ncbi:hypothetical protein BUALT_Bualt09G0077100 [Buddleja alternifolia]|uniref:Uncharacterized protein n=1 Tax=Buddleja alternifolia TaxID=168488 RepID=A0AAV6X2G6_9LAMI|nr:hypothetical protein BUALT_Bualt09G0077100 [Buddleja alternifolia]